MPERSDIDRLLDILDEANVLAEALEGVTSDAFQADAVLQRAVLHILQTIGEAASHLSAETIAAVPGQP